MKNVWKHSEIRLLYEIYPTVGDDVLMNYFSGRTLTSIKIKAKRLKIYRTEETKKQNRSNANAGEKNGMYGKTSKIKGKTYDEYYGSEISNTIKNKLSSNKIGKIGLVGEKNGMYGKIPYNKGLSPSEVVKNNIRKGVVDYWSSLDIGELETRKRKLREDWIIKRNKYSEIDTIPEKIIESFLVNQNIEYTKKINIGYYNCDFLVNDVVIEVQGDYWHGNPRIYSVFDKIQQKNIKRDNRKMKFLSQKGYKVLYLWEYDIKKNPDYCKELITTILNG